MVLVIHILVNKCVGNRKYNKYTTYHVIRLLDDLKTRKRVRRMRVKSGEVVAVLNKVVRASLIDKVPFEQDSGNKGLGHVYI